MARRTCWRQRPLYLVERANKSQIAGGNSKLSQKRRNLYFFGEKNMTLIYNSNLSGNERNAKWLYDVSLEI